jgi:uncharacterized protein (TIGR01777 family)
VKIVVSGASGLIGSALVPALTAAGHDILRLVRGEARGADEIAWDPDRGSLDPASLAGIDAVVNLSGATIGKRWTESRRQEILASRVGTTGLLARTLAELEPKPSAFVVAGGIGIYGHRGDEVLTEASELGTGFLAEVGKAWETAAEPAREAGIRTVTFRQGVVLSRDGGALERMLLPFKLGLGGRIADGKQWWSWIALDDVVAGYRRALEGDLSGPVNLTSPSPATNAVFTKALGRALGRPTVFPLPALAVRTLFGEMGEAMLVEGQRGLPKRLLDAGFEFAYPELDDALTRALEE